MAGRPERIAVAVLALAGACAATPAGAFAVDRYVDDGGANSNPACPQANPCDTIAYALANSSAGDEIILDNGTYPESVTLGDGRSLSFSNFAPGDAIGPAIVDGGVNPAVTVDASGAGEITGLTLRSDAAGVQANGAVEIGSNTFDEPDGAGTVIGVTGGASGLVIHDNTFIDPAPDNTRGRIGIFAGSGPQIRDNTFIGQNLAIQAFGDGTLIEGNSISETHDAPFVARGILLSSGGTVTVRENVITDAATDSVTGIEVSSQASLVRNEVTGHATGILVGNDVTGVTVEGDRLWANGFGLRLLDLAIGAPQTSATATNITAVENGTSVLNAGSVLALDSSIVDDLAFGGSAAPTCTITFSRGDDTDGTDPTGCDGFQTDADPMLVDAPDGDLHLQPGSPMIDAGNPAAPAVGALDFDGDTRALDATPACSGNVARRDIGADEFAPTPVDCEPPETAFTKTPPKKTKRKTVRFKFEADEPATFSCQLDDKPESACDSPAEVNVKPGRHKFLVTATDTASNVEVEPAKYRFRRTR